MAGRARSVRNGAGPASLANPPALATGRATADQERIREFSAAQLVGQDPHALAAVRRSNPAQVVTETQITSVAVPTLGVVGTADPYLSQFQALKAVMPQLQLVTIEGASHGSAPGRSEFTHAILAFLRAHPAVSDR